MLLTRLKQHGRKLTIHCDKRKTKQTKPKKKNMYENVFTGIQQDKFINQLFNYGIIISKTQEAGKMERGREVLTLYTQSLLMELSLNENNF